MKFYHYPKSTTSKNPPNFLHHHHLNYQSIHILQHTPTKKQFKNILHKTPVNINNFFNTHPIKYPQLNLE
ncbi:thioredoxin domain-containing protein, partial [Staphylococcus epidermidis]